MTWNNPILKFLMILLTPISFLWDGIYRLRRFLYSYNFIKVDKFQVPIISVGNLTFGGTGKTPFTIWLSEYINQKNKKVMILSRGYKGNLENSSGILRSGKKLGFNPFEYGDEALLLVRRLKNAVVVVGNKRRDSRIAPIGQPAVEAITIYIRLRCCLIKELEVKGVPEDLFLAINAKPLSRRSIQKRVYEGLYRIADVRAFNPNILRQSFKAHLLNSGADVNSVRYMLGQVVTSSLNSPPERPIEELIEAYGKAHPRSN